MKAIQVTAFGGADALQMRDVPIPAPGPDEVLVRIARGGVNFMDIYMRSGVYARSGTYETPLPMTLGMEAAGTIERLGAAVSAWKIGDRVAYCLSRGSYAEFAVVPTWKLVAIPDAISFDEAAALMLQGSTAHYLTHSAHELKAGQTCLVHAGAGGVGQLLVQLAKLRGATVIATVGSDEKVEIASARGADVCIRYKSQDFRQRVMEITDGTGVDVVYDSVGRDTIDASIRCVRRRGLCILFGASSGAVKCVEPIQLAEAGSVFFTRPHLADYMATSKERQWRASDLFDALTQRLLKVTLHGLLPLQEAAEAHRLLEGGATKGKLLLAVS